MCIDNLWYNIVNMKNQKTFVSIVTIFIIAVVVIMGGYFVIKQSKEINIIFPNGGEILEVGKTYEILWDSKNIPSSEKVSIFYNYSKKSGTIAAGIPNSGRYSWKVSEVEVLGEDDKPSPTGPFYLSISYYKTSGGGWEPSVEAIVDRSDGPFTIITVP